MGYTIQTPKLGSMEIVILGAGLAGLSAYLHLRAHLPATIEYKITIVESHSSLSKKNDSPSTFTGGLGLGPNGMRILRKLSPAVYSEVVDAGFKAEWFEFKTEGGWSLGKWPAKATTDNEPSVMMDRKTLWQVLRSHVPDEAIREGVKVTKVESDGIVHLENGEILKADLVLGADGVRSVARHCVVDEGEQGRDPEFQNLMNVGGAMPSKFLDNLDKPDTASVVLTFGSTGFVGYAPFTNSGASSASKHLPGPVSMWWSTYAEKPSESTRKTTNEPANPNLRTEMYDRHHTWADPTIQKISKGLKQDAQSADPQDTVAINLHTPTWIIRKIPRWRRGRVILLGDAAHTLPSTSGQGVSQALEDAVAISLLLAGELNKDGDRDADDLCARVGSRYEQIRKPRVDKMLDAALRAQSSKKEMSLFERTLMYLILWLLMKFGGGKQEAWRLDYDIEAETKKMLSQS